MTHERMSRPAMLGAGAAGGFLSGLVGGGGGSIMIPLMTGVLGLRQHVAHGTSLVIIAGSAAAGSIAYMAAGDVRWHLVLFLLAGSLVGARIGALGAAKLPAMQLRRILAVFLICVALRLILIASVDPAFGSTSRIEELIVGAGIGFFGGLASGALGVGGGSIFVPALVLLLGTDQHVAQGVSLCVIVVTSIVGALAHHRAGNVNIEASKWIAPIALPAGMLGAFAAGYLGDRALRVIVSTVILAIGIQMLVTATRRLRNESRAAALQGSTP